LSNAKEENSDNSDEIVFSASKPEDAGARDKEPGTTAETPEKLGRTTMHFSNASK
jgi:hypothetical protein